MGDSSWCCFTIPDEDWDLVKDKFEDDDWEEDGAAGYHRLHNHEARSGGYSIHEELMDQEITHCYESGACSGVWEESTTYYVPSLNLHGEIAGSDPRARVSAEGEVSKEDLEAIAEYYRAKEAFEAIIAAPAATTKTTTDGDAMLRI